MKANHNTEDDVRNQRLMLVAEANQKFESKSQHMGYKRLYDLLMLVAEANQKFESKSQLLTGRQGVGKRCW